MGDYEDNELFYDYHYRDEFMRLEFFEIYLSNIERLIEESRAELAEAIKKANEENKYTNIDDVEAMLKWGDDWMFEQKIWNSSNDNLGLTPEEAFRDDLSSELFYPSFFISLYADFEKSLVRLCYELRSPNEQRSIQDVSKKGSVIERSKTYLVKVHGVDAKFFGNHRFKKISTYGPLRNNLVHDVTEKIPYIEKEKINFICKDDPKLLSLHKKGGITWVSVNKEFCSDAISVIGNFWIYLFHELSKKFSLGYNHTYHGNSTITGR